MDLYICKQCGLIVNEKGECELCKVPMDFWKQDLTGEDFETIQKFIFKEKSRRKHGFVTDDYIIIKIDGVYKTLQELTEEEMEKLCVQEEN